LHRHLRLAATTALLPSLSPRVTAQDATSEFEVASVKRNTTARGRFVPRVSPGRLSIAAVTLRDLIGGAYRSPGTEVIIEGPGWIDTDLFEVEARTRDGAPVEMAMLQHLLAGRFKLRVRRERRERPVFELRLGARSGKPGPQLTRSTCLPADSTLPAAARGGSQGQPATASQQPPPTCAPIRIGAGPTIIGKGVTLSELAEFLAGFPEVNRVVYDRTELDGRFNFRMQWVAGGPTVDPGAGPDLFAALRDRLGLRLERSTALIDVVIVDHAEPLTEN
jgi:uncharacterized protein (TIGR03435 family)